MAGIHVAAPVPGGEITLCCSPKPTRIGLPYYILQHTGIDCGYPTKFAIWHNELSWLVSSLSLLSENLLFERFTRPGFYPLLSTMRSSGGLSWFAIIRENGRKHLALRRYADYFVDEEKKTHTRFFEFSRYGKYPQQVLWPFPSAQEGFLRAFANKCVAAFAAECERILELAEAYGCEPLPTPDNIFQRLAVTTTLGTTKRRMITPVGLDFSSPAEFIVLQDDVQNLVLSVCTAAATADDISNSLGHELDATAVRDFTCWMRRYDPVVVREAYIFSIVDHQRVLAVRDRSVFANDPLLVSLGSPVPTDGSGSEEWIRAPQCTARQIEAAQARGWIEQAPHTALGRVPVPTAERRSTIRPFVTAPAVLRMQRWKVLQLLDDCSSSACNLPGGLAKDLVVHLQLLALLMHDVSELFAGDSEPAVEAFLERARSRFRGLLAGRAPDPAPRAELPRKPRTSDE